MVNKYHEPASGFGLGGLPSGRNYIAANPAGEGPVALHSSSCAGANLAFRQQPIRVRQEGAQVQGQGRGVNKNKAEVAGNTEVNGEDSVAEGDEEKTGAALMTPHVDAVDADGST